MNVGYPCVATTGVHLDVGGGDRDMFQILNLGDPES